MILFKEKNQIKNFKIGDAIGVSNFADIKKVDVQGISKGKGFAGTIKRWNFGAQRASHGNSVSHRVPGSIGQCQDPGKVFKGKKMCGHLGNATTTVQNLEIVKKICRILDELIPMKRSYQEFISFVADRPGHDWRYAMDITKILTDLGWKPATSLEKRLLKTVGFYLQSPLLD